MGEANLRSLVVYYSFEGNTRLVARAISEKTGADLLELKPRNEIQTHGFMKYFWGGKQAMRKEKPALLPFDKKVAEYDLIFIGTPVWASTFAPPVNTFLGEQTITGKKIALFCCADGSKGKTFEHFRAALEGNEILGEHELITPLKKDPTQLQQQVGEWVQRILDQV